MTGRIRRESLKAAVRAVYRELSDDADYEKARREDSDMYERSVTLATAALMAARRATL